MDSSDNKALTKTEAVSFEKLKLKWKELNEEVFFFINFCFWACFWECMFLRILYLTVCIWTAHVLYRNTLRNVLKSSLMQLELLKSVLNQRYSCWPTRIYDGLRSCSITWYCLLDPVSLSSSLQGFFKGFDANTKISQICFFTPYKELRDYLSSILIERKIVNESEIEMIEYLKKLETVYICRSFAQAKQKLRLYRYVDSLFVFDFNVGILETGVALWRIRIKGLMKTLNAMI